MLRKLLIVSIGFLVFYLLINYVTSDTFNPLNQKYFAIHKPLDAWKIYELRKLKIIPFPYHFDIELPDLAEGRFFSYVDPPISYLLAFGISFLVPSAIPHNFLITIKLTEFLNYSASFLLLIVLMRKLGVNLLTAYLVSLSLFISYRFWESISYLHLSGFWSLILPLILYLKFNQEKSVRSASLLGLGLSISLLQDVYYGLAIVFFLAVPLSVTLAGSMKKDIMKDLVLISLLLISFTLPVVLLKGADLSYIFRTDFQDPTLRTPGYKTITAYRPWYHLIPIPSARVFGFLFRPVRDFVYNLPFIDHVTLLSPVSEFSDYISYPLILLALFLSFRFRERIPWRYLAALLFFLFIFTKSDFWFNGRHIVLFSYKIQNVLRISTLTRVGQLTILLFFVYLAFLIGRVKRQVLSAGLSVLVVIVTFLEMSGNRGIPCEMRTDESLVRYLHSAPPTNRLFIELPRCLVNTSDLVNNGLDESNLLDGRYFQIFHSQPIFARGSISWLDFYRYQPPLAELRTLRSLLTGINDGLLREMGIKEVVVLLGGYSPRDYYENNFRDIDSVKREKVFFDQSIVFKVI